MRFKNILITGGAGYIGSILTSNLIYSNYNVVVLDKLLFKKDSLLEFLNFKNFTLVKEDIRNHNILDNIIEKYKIDAIIHLAAIVGDPASKKYPKLTKEVNLDASKQLYQLANKNKVKRFIFVSTCSNYGKMQNRNELITEESPLKPLSLYAETKVLVEKFLLSQNKDVYTKPTILRFATAYGISKRMRFDLTVNEFTKELILERQLLVYGQQFWRPYCHVVDLAKAMQLVLESDERVNFNVYNVGDNEENYTKKMIVNLIKKHIPHANIKYIKKEEDPRDYKVNFDKIKEQLNFKITKRVEDGITQIIEAIKMQLIDDPDSEIYRNS